MLFFPKSFVRVKLFHSQLPLTGLHLLPLHYFILKYSVNILCDLEKAYIVTYPTQAWIESSGFPFKFLLRLMYLSICFNCMRHKSPSNRQYSCNLHEETNTA